MSAQSTSAEEEGTPLDPDFFGYDFLEQLFAQEDELADCPLEKDELVELLAPSQETWNEYPSMNYPSILSIDSSKLKQWELAKAEFHHVRGSMQTLLKIEDPKDITDDAIVMHSIGPDSEVGLFLCNEIEIDKKMYCKFMSTLLIQAAYRVSSTELFAKHSLLKEHLMMTQNEFNGIWKLMANKKKLPSSQIRTARTEAPLWESMELIVNKLCREISVTDRTGRISIALDDDKIWFASTVATSSDLFNLKFTTHVKPNRKGICLHSAVSSGLNIPLAAVFERTKDNSISCFKRLLDFLFSHDGSTDLRNVSVHSDRGYMLPNLVFEYLLSSGAEVVGTCKRMAQCWPFTYNQKVKPNDKRTHIDPKGSPTLYLKWCKAGSKYLFASAFRNGSESVATALSSLHNQHQWEGVVLKHSELANYKEDPKSLRSSFFQRVNLSGFAGINSDESIAEKLLFEMLLDVIIEAYTLRQGTADWHYLRKFSLTSSQAHGAFIKAFPMYKDNASWIAVAKYMYGDQWKEILLPAPQQDEENADEGATAGGNTRTHETIAIELFLHQYDDYAHDDISQIATLQFLRRYTCGFSPQVGAIPSEDDSDSDDGNEDNTELSRWQPGQNPIIVGSETEAKDIVTNRLRTANAKKGVINILTSHVPLRYRKKLTTKDIHLWLQKPNSVRTYMFYKSAGLKELMKERELCFPPGTGRVAASQMIDALAGIPGSGAVDQAILAVEGPEPEEELDAKGEVIKSILNKSFLPHQKGANREFCSLGHRLEIPIVKSWIKVVTGSESPQPELEVHGAYTAGLAAKKGAVYAKDSIDFLLTVSDPSSGYATKIWGFEAKGRVTATSAADEEHHLRQLVDPHVRMKDEEVHSFVRKEAERFQTLQHAYVYNLDTVVLAISDKQSELIRSAIIDYSTDLRMHFGNVLKDLKDISLDWIYSALPTPGEANSLRHHVVTIPQDIVNIAKHVKTINGEDTLQGTVNLWLSMCMIPKPFPSFRRLIPAIYAFWNSVKGGSDTTTKLMDDCIVQIPKSHINTETVAITRLLQFLNVLNHRVMQAFSAKADLPYPSLSHYRKAASERQTYHSTLMKSSSVFCKYLKDIEEEERKESALQGHAVQTPPQGVRRAPRRQRIDGALPEQTAFGGNLPFKTPKKHGNLIRTGQASDDVREMVKYCTGRPMQIYPTKSDYPCFICKANTSWYCAGCKLWVCASRRATKNSLKDLELYSHTIKSKPRNFVKSCFHKMHQEAWQRSDQNQQNNIGKENATPS